MADTYSSGAGAGIDLSQFYQVFFEEAGENLATMEQMLLGLDLASANDEELNAVFRCAHSVKGGAATFGFSDVAELTHQMETLLDKLRRHELEPHPSMVDVLLAAGDALKAQLARHQGAGGRHRTASGRHRASVRRCRRGRTGREAGRIGCRFIHCRGSARRSRTGRRTPARTHRRSAV
jgi:chemotaxis protein histidine kinase CheA